MRFAAAGPCMLLVPLQDEVGHLLPAVLPREVTAAGVLAVVGREGAFPWCLKLALFTDGGQMRSSLPVTSTSGARSGFL